MRREAGGEKRERRRASDNKLARGKGKGALSSLYYHSRATADQTYLLTYLEPLPIFPCRRLPSLSNFVPCIPPPRVRPADTAVELSHISTH